tara:strand:+ start:16528 stop:16884 length:357 start_codon:yes stop_codon:yes gene_type:complete
MLKTEEIKKRISTPLAFMGLILISITILQICGKEKDTALVNSGTYIGIVTDAVEPAREFYVKLTNDSLVRLNFSSETTLTKNGETVPFGELKEDSKVEVKLERMEEKMNPISVKILEK